MGRGGENRRSIGGSFETNQWEFHSLAIAILSSFNMEGADQLSKHGIELRTLRSIIQFPGIVASIELTNRVILLL